MEQFVLRLPDSLATRVHELIETEVLNEQSVCYEATGQLNGRDFILKLGIEHYPGTLGIA